MGAVTPCGMHDGRHLGEHPRRPVGRLAHRGGSTMPEGTREHRRPGQGLRSDRVHGRSAPCARPTASPSSRWPRRRRRSPMPTSTSPPTRARIGCSIGTGIGGLKTQEIAHAKLFEAGPDRLNPFWVTALIANMGAAEVSMALGTRGPLTTECDRLRRVGHVARERDDVHPRRDGRRDAGGRRRGADRAARAGRVRHDAGAVAAAGRPRGREPAVRLAAATASSCRRASTVLVLEELERARGARRPHLRRGARLRHVVATPTT